MSISRLVFAPYEPGMGDEVRELFREYSHKDYQLRAMGVTKDRMAGYLIRTLTRPGVQTICLRDNGCLVGLIALQSLPWMSDHFGLKMYAVTHLLARSDDPLVPARLLRFVVEELHDVDFLDCRIAVDDVHAAQSLEVCGFRYVGTELYLGRKLEPEDTPDAPDPPEGVEFRIRQPEDCEQILDIVEETHIHNRFVYDPIIDERAARLLYKRLVANVFDQPQFKVLVARSHGEVQGFIISKINRIFAEVVGIRSGSLDFIGVRPHVRNRGLGAALNRAALSGMAAQGTEFVAVRTFAGNYPALRITFTTGFSVTSTSLHFHKWVHRPREAQQPAMEEEYNMLRFSYQTG